MPPRCVAEHEQEVQQLCETLEQQIQEERQRLQQEVGLRLLLTPVGTQHPQPPWQLPAGANVLIAIPEHGEEPPAQRGAAASAGCQ